jgi:translation initiation factor 3 subunit B
MADTIDPSAVARDLFRDQPLGFPYSNFDVAELILPDGDDMGLRSDDDDIDSEQIETETGFGNVIGASSGGQPAPARWRR